MKKKYNVHIIEKRCKMCGICVGFCPEKVLDMNINSIPEIVNSDSCIGCNICYQKCPEIAVIVEGKEIRQSE